MTDEATDWGKMRSLLGRVFGTRVAKKARGVGTYQVSKSSTGRCMQGAEVNNNDVLWHVIL